MICLDTTILIWGVQGVSDNHRGDMPEKAKRYIEYLTQQGKRIMVPAPVIHEFLTGIIPSEIQQFLSVLSQHQLFYVPSFDFPSAVKAADLDRDRNEMKDICSSFGLKRQEIKIDTQIIAIAIMHGEDEIITDNVDHFERIAKDRIKISQLPDIPTQEELLI